MTRREKTLSTKLFKTYKYLVFAAFLALGLLVLWFLIKKYSQGFSFEGLVWVMYLYQLYRLFQRSQRVFRAFFQISYDKDSLYLHTNNQDTEIPFEMIKHVELKSLDGLYRFELFQEQHFGKYIYCKPSIWYPFDFPRVDKELDWIRHLINQKRKSLADEQQNLLHSQYQ